MRADKFFAARYGSRNKAKAALQAGEISKNGRILSPDDDVDSEDGVLFLRRELFVSLGGDKLERGLTFFKESVEGRIIADLGASTGGFTDCLLRRGARKVFCVDVGENQLAPALKSDPRVVIMDHTNARYLTRASFPEPIGDVTADLSFISLRLVLPAVRDILEEGGRAFVLFKPQFECEGKGLGKSGILPRGLHAPLLRSFYGFSLALGLAPRAAVPAPVREKKNAEYVLFLQKGAVPAGEEAFLSMALRGGEKI